MCEQIKEAIKNEIITQNLQAEEILPSIRLLAKELNISMITSKRAYIDLEHEGFIYTIPGKGTFVNSKLKAEGIDQEDVLKLLKEIYEK